MSSYDSLVYIVSKSIETLNSFSIADIPFFYFVVGIAFFSLLLSYIWG